LKVYYSLDEVPLIKNPVLTLGTFDGVHSGHQLIIDFLSKSAERINGETVLFTFHPHPRMVLHPDDHNLQLIQDIDRRIERLREAGIDHLILFPFTKEFSRMTATEFVRNILVNKLNVKLMTIGYNHHFGRNREGNIALLREIGPIYNFEVEEIPAHSYDEVNVSSTKTRKAIEAGDIKTVNHYLGRPFRFKGTIVKGNQIGREIGFPTANLAEIDPVQIIPNSGVFAVKCKISGIVYDGMMNIGTRPTIESENEKRIEINIFNFNQDVYGEQMEVYLLDKVRDEQQFKDIEALKEQLKKDEINCKHIFTESAVRL
jgi:riboflavin kinase/FMN adenylyltransferase